MAKEKIPNLKNKDSKKRYAEKKAAERQLKKELINGYHRLKRYYRFLLDELMEERASGVRTEAAAEVIQDQMIHTNLSIKAIRERLESLKIGVEELEKKKESRGIKKPGRKPIGRDDSVIDAEGDEDDDLPEEIEFKTD